MALFIYRVPTVAERCARRAYEAFVASRAGAGDPPWNLLGRETRDVWIDVVTAAIVEYSSDAAAGAAHERLRESMSLTPDEGDDVQRQFSCHGYAIAAGSCCPECQAEAPL